MTPVVAWCIGWTVFLALEALVCAPWSLAAGILDAAGAGLSAGLGAYFWSRE